MEKSRPLKSLVQMLKLESHIFSHFSSYSLRKNKNKTKKKLDFQSISLIITVHTSSLRTIEYF